MTLPALQKNHLSEIRSLILETLQNSGMFIRKAEIDYIASQLDGAGELRSFIPAQLIENSSVVESSVLNRYMEGCTVDHMISYAKLKVLMEALDDSEILFNNNVVPMISSIIESESKIKAFEKIINERGRYNKIIHDTFNTDNNYIGDDRKLKTNRTTGTLRLGSSGRVLTDKETCNISYELLSSGVFVMDQSSIENIYNRDPFRSWYVSIGAKTPPVNRSYSNIDLSEYPGVVVLLRITFPSMQQLNRISISQFSTNIMDTLGVFYSEKHGNTLDSLALSHVDIEFYKNSDDTDIEMNVFKRNETESEIISATEVLIVLGQRHYIEVDGSISYETKPSVEKLIELIEKEEMAFRIKKESISAMHAGDLKFDVTSIIDKMDTVNIQEGDRNYIIGMRLFSIENLVYEPYGIFRSPPIQTGGNAISFGLDISEKPMDVQEAVEKFTLNIGNQRIPIAVPMSNGMIKDSFLLSVKDGKFTGETSFIPDITVGDKINGNLFLDGFILLPDNYILGPTTQNGQTIYVTSTNAHDGSIITAEYIPATKDRGDSAYDPSRVNLISRIGKPNIDINFITYNTNDYMYLSGIDDSGMPSVVSFMEGTELFYADVADRRFGVIHSGNEKRLATISGEYIPTEKEEESSIFNTEDYRYILPASVIDIPEEVYAILKNQKFSVIVDDAVYGESTGYSSWATLPNTIKSTKEDELELGLLNDHNYAKNLIIIEADGIMYRPSSDQQYSLDTPESIKPKNRVRVKVEWIKNRKNIRLHYVPLYKTDEVEAALESNILNQNVEERFDRSSRNTVTLTGAPYLDPDIIISPKWILSKGVFYRSDNFSIIYEPIKITVNGKDAINQTQYFETQEKETINSTEITYTVNGKIVTFNRDVQNVIISYYSIGDSFTLDVEMFKGDNSRYFITPELKDYTVKIAMWTSVGGDRKKI